MLKAFAYGAAIVLAAGTARADLLVSVDTWTQQMTVYVDGQPQYQWLVSTGGDGYATPAGAYRPFRLELDHYSKEWDDAPMPHSIFFTEQGHAIHGTDSTRSLGSPVSHGCVRLAPENAALLFELVQAHGLGNSRVEVVGSAWEEAGTPTWSDTENYEPVDRPVRYETDLF